MSLPVFKVNNLALCFQFALLLCIHNIFLTYSIRSNMLVIQIWEMLWLQVNLFHFLNLSHVQQWKIGFAPFGGLYGGYYFYAAEYHVYNRPMHAAFPPSFPSSPLCFLGGSLLTLQAFNTFLIQELCCWKCKSPAIYSHDPSTDVQLILVWCSVRSRCSAVHIWSSGLVWFVFPSKCATLFLEREKKKATRTLFPIP